MRSASNCFEIPLQFLDRFALTCAPDPPPTPDYTGAARAQGQANIDAAVTQSKLNNPNVVNPYGTQTVQYKDSFDQKGYDDAVAGWNRAQAIHRAKYGVDIPTTAYRDGYRPPTRADYTETGIPTITQTFSPEQQKIFDEGNKAKLALSQLATRGAGAAGDVIGKNVDFSGMPAAPGSAEDVRAKVLDAQMARVNEDYANAVDDKQSALIASGIRPGTKAYDDAMNLLQRGRNDAFNQAYLASGQEMSRDFAQDTQRRKDAIAEYLTQRQVPLNEVTALMSGSQVNNPFAVPGYAQNSQVAAAPLFAAQNAMADYNTDVYNAKAAQAGNLQSGLFGIGGSAIQAAPGLMALSDRRLKSNIVRIGDHPLGIGWYEYDIQGRREQGVMADEVLTVKPEAVVSHPDGYLMVDYGQIGRVA